MSSQFKVADAKRLIGAVQKKGLTVKSITSAKDGTLTISVARPAPPELPTDPELINEWDNRGSK